MPDRVIYVVRSWPRLSQTFIVNEVLALERRGLELVVFSLVRSGEVVVQPQVADVRAPVHYLDGPRARDADVRRLLSSFAIAPLRSRSARWSHCLLHPRLAAGYGECSTLPVPRPRVVVSRPSSGTCAPHGDEPVRVHAHFAHDPALVGMLVARLTGLPFSFTAHARDLFEIPPQSLTARAREATAVVTCCEVNAAYIESVVPHQRPASGASWSTTASTCTGSPRRGQVTRAHLRCSCRSDGWSRRRDSPTCSARCAGEATGACPSTSGSAATGRCTPSSSGCATTLGLADEVELRGAEDSDAVVAALHQATVFALTPRELADGDRDGIPNVLVEAMACGLPGRHHDRRRHHRARRARRERPARRAR